MSTVNPATTSSVSPAAIDRWQNPIPPAVKRYAEQAEALQAQLRDQGIVTTVEDAPPLPPQEEPQEQPQEAQETFSDGGAVQQPPAYEPPQQPPQAAEDDDSWRHKFQSEQGRTQALRSDVSRLSDEITNLRRLLATVQSAPPPPPSRQETFKADITAEERAQWGDDLIGIIERKAREIADQQTEELREQVRQLGGQVHNVGQAAAINAFERMKQTLDGMREISNWRHLNDAQEFVAWLAYPDRLSGRKRHDMLQEAWSQCDAGRVSAFFADFLKDYPGLAPSPARQAAGGAGQQPTKPTLESMAAPGKARSSAPASNGAGRDAKPRITTGDISRFYADKIAGRFKGREADADAYEREIYAADKEGRIVQTSALSR